MPTASEAEQRSAERTLGIGVRKLPAVLSYRPQSEISCLIEISEVRIITCPRE